MVTHVWLWRSVLLAALLTTCAVGVLLLPRAVVQAATTWFVDADAEGLVAWWTFDEGAGASVYDLSPTGATGTITNGATFSTNKPPVITRFNPGSMSFDGVDDGVAVPDLTPLKLSTDFTFAAWVRRASTTTFDFMYDSGTANGHWAIGFADNITGPLIFGERNVKQHYAVGGVTDLNWHHIAVVKDGDAGANIAYYVDGAQVGASTVGTVTVPSGGHRIGRLTDTAAGAHAGQLDDVRLYNRALTAAEIQRLAQGRGCASDGATWNTAFSNPLCALEVALDGDEIWMAKGQYKPGTNRSATFFVDRSLTLRGGFAGGESTPAQRPPFDPDAALTPANYTLFNGDIEGNDVGLTNNISNAFNVTVISGTGASVLLEGFAIRGGAATGAGSGPVLNRNGGGLHVGAGSVAVQNMLVAENQAGALSTVGSGAGLFATPPITIIDSYFKRNNAPGGDGGGALVQTATVLGGRFESNVSRIFGIGNGGGIRANRFATISGTGFLSNTAGGFGGGVNAFQAVITAARFENNQVAIFSGGGLHVDLDASLSGVTFKGNRGKVNGGGGADFGAGPVLIEGGTFEGNTAEASFPQSPARGGAILSFASALTISGTTFLSNTANGKGGALTLFTFSPTQTTSLINVQLISNTAPFGGAIELAGGTGSVIIDRSSFTGNQATVLGGAMFGVTDSVPSTLTVRNSTFTANRVVSGAGGAVHLTGNPVFVDVSFRGNTADGSGQGGLRGVGGGMHVDGSPILTNVLFQQNRAERDGSSSLQVSANGGGLSVHGNPMLSAVTFLSNTAVGTPDIASFGIGVAFGGGMFLSGTGSLQEVAFIGNLAGAPGKVGVGGGLHSIGRPVISGAVFSRNTVENGLILGSGGGFSYEGDPVVSGALFEGNQAGAGGGVAVLSGSIQIERSRFVSNLASGSATSAGRGGGINVDEFGRVSITNSVFLSNAVASAALGDPAVGAALGGANGRADLTHVTFANNTGGAAISFQAVFDSSTLGPPPPPILNVTNAVFHGHGVAVEVTAEVVASVNGVLWSGNVLNTAGTVTVTNAFTGPAALAPDGYHLTSGSAAINRAVASAVTVDIDRDKRPPGSPDLGADEFITLLYLPSGGKGYAGGW